MTDMLLDVSVVGILRGVDPEFFKAVMHVSFEQGLKAIEITLNTENALDMLKENRSSVPHGCLLGAGTVCCLKEAQQAIDSGAMFLVTPNVDPEVIEYAVLKKIPVVAGALTPTEIYQAWKSGAAMIKVFPCQAMGGAQYIREIRGPFDKIALCAVGGVTIQNLPDYFKAGAQAVGVSSSLFGKPALAQKDLAALAVNVRQFVEAGRR